MARQRHLQQSFNAGEISPRMAARTDFEKYDSACALLQNYIPLVHGGVIRRAGTHFAAEVKTSSLFTRLIPFEFSTVQAYVIEAGNLYFRFYRNLGRIDVPNTDGVISNGTFPTDLTGWTDDDSGTGTSVHDTGNGGQMKLNGGSSGIAARTQAVTIGAGFTAVAHVISFEVRTNAATLNIGTSSGGGQIKADTVYQPGFHVVEFTPGATTFHVRFKNPNNNDSFLDNVSLLDNVPLEIPTPYTTSELGFIQYAQSADVAWLTDDIFKPRKLLRFGNMSWSLISYVPTADPFTSAGNFPATVGFIEQRIVFAATINSPQKFFMGRSGDFEDMTVGSLDDDGLAYDIASGQVNTIFWLLETQRGLVLGTSGSEHTVTGSGVEQAITPTNVLVRRRSNSGSRDQTRGIISGSSTVFVSKSGRKLMEFSYQYESDAFVALDLTLLAEHITEDAPIVEVAKVEEPSPILWAIKQNGELLSVTFNRAQDVIGWARHPLGGSFSGGSPLVESITVIPHPGLARDSLWMIVKRTINGATKRYVEFLGEEEGAQGEVESPYERLLVDSGLTYSGGATSTLSGLGHLEGETVDIVGDGAVYPQKVVSGGQVTGLTPALTRADIGLHFEPRLRTLRPSIEGFQAVLKAMPSIFVRVKDTLGIKVNGDSIPWRLPADPMDSNESLKTADVEVNNIDVERDFFIEITQPVPQPCEILMIEGTIFFET